MASINNYNYFTLFVGMFDKDTKTLLWDIDEAEEKIAEIMTEICGGATITRSLGVYKHNDKTIVREPSFRIETWGVSEAQAKGAAEAMKDMFNQESIGYRAESVYTDYI